MAGVLKYVSAHMEIQYEGETDEQYRTRVERMEAWNAEAERIEKAWAPSPMKGLRAGWDCGCNQEQFEQCEHEWCPRLFSHSPLSGHEHE